MINSQMTLIEQEGFGVNRHKSTTEDDSFTQYDLQLLVEIHGLERDIQVKSFKIIKLFLLIHIFDLFVLAQNNKIASKRCLKGFNWFSYPLYILIRSIILGELLKTVTQHLFDQCHIITVIGTNYHDSRLVITD